MAVVDVNHPPAGGFVNGAWYWDPSINQAKEFWNGSFGAGTTINNPNQQGYGQTVSQEVQKQSGYVAPTTQPSNTSGGGSTASGGGSAPAASGAPQVPDLNAKYQSLLNTDEYKAAQEKFGELQDQIDKIDEDRNTAISEDQNNPWFSQATRGGKIAAINGDADRKIANLTSQQKEYSDSISSIESDAQNQVNLIAQQYGLQENAFKDAQAANAVSTTEYDDGKNVYLVSYDSKGNVTNKVLVGASKPTTSGATGGVAQQTFNSTLQGLQWSKSSSGQSVSPFMQLVASYANALTLDEIYKMYMQSPQGQKYGAPTES